MAASANLIGIYVSVLLKYPPNSTVRGTVAQIVPQTSTLVLREGKMPRIVLNLITTNSSYSLVPRYGPSTADLDCRWLSDRRHQYRQEATR